MKTFVTVAASVLAGMAIGAGVLHAIHAQEKPPVYMIALNEVSNPDGYSKEYLPPAKASINTYGGVYVAAGPQSMEALQRWRTSPEYTAAHKVGMKYAKYNIVAVDGVEH